VKQDETLLTCLSELYNRIRGQKKKTGLLAPRKFITKLRKENGFLNFSLISQLFNHLIILK